LNSYFAADVATSPLRRPFMLHRKLASIKTLTAAAAAVLLSTTVARHASAMPAVLDLTAKDSSGMINGGLFEQAEFQPAGTGVLDSFVRIQGHNKDGVEQGYNTDFRPVQFDEKTDAPHTRSLLLSNVPIVNVDGTDYRQFILDINEPQGGGKSEISLDSLQLFLGDGPALHDYPTFDGHATLVYDLDSGADHEILLDAATNKGGSGKGDMFAFIPNSDFTGGNPYVYLYSEFGLEQPAEGGFEEWAVGKSSSNPAAVPLPSAAWSGLACLGLLGAARLKARRRLA
jgi:hypothetical protein